MNPWKNLTLTLAALFLVAGWTVRARAAEGALEIYVSPAGHDTDPGTPAQPLASPARAQALVRELIKAPGGLKAPVRVVLRGGTYFLAAPLVFGPQDSGTAACPITYTAAPGETPILSGGRRITGWGPDTINGQKCWSADLAAQGFKNWNFRELFVDGQRRPRTRLPKTDYYRFDPATPKHEWNSRPESVRFVKGDLKNWANLSDVELVFLNRWFDIHQPIGRIDEASGTLYFSPRSFHGIYDSKNEPSRYWVENVREALNTPGQWYLDRPAGKLYYLALPGETMQNKAIAPALETLVQLGSAPVRGAGASGGAKVSFVRLEHLSFEHAEQRETAPSSQAASTVSGVVKVGLAASCTLYDCTIARVGGYAVEFGPGSTDCELIACRMQDLGAGGVRIEDGSRHTTVSDCTICQGGRIWLQACGILLRNSGQNRILHNHIYDLFYTGISSGWNWGYNPTATVDNRIEDNLIHDLGHGVLDDMGGIYTLGAHPGGVLRGNVIHDVFDYFYGGWGLYHDEGSAYFLDENNLTFRTNKGGFHQHYGRDNLLRNNIFATAVQKGLERTRSEQIRSFVFDGNIIYPGATAQLLGNNWRDGRYLMRNNIYWRQGDGPLDFEGKTFAAWQQTGQDAGSKVADPLFVDPTGGNFTLRPESPALALGFKPFDPSKAGPRLNLNPRQVALEAWPRPDETPRPILEWRLDTTETLARPQSTRYNNKLTLSAAKPQAIVYTVVNRGAVAAQGRVEFQIEPVGAAVMVDASGVTPQLNYNLKPGEKAEVRFMALVKGTMKETACKLQATALGDGLRDSVLYFN